MAFVDDFSADHRQLFETAAMPLQLARGQYLLRRGEPGGDIYLVTRGQLEVVDTRSTPEVILAVLDEGAMVGEMAFVDDSPRSADVRAANVVEVLRWPRDDLRALLSRNPEFSAVFYQSMARLAADRIRSLTTTAMAGALGQQKGGNAVGIAAVKQEVRTMSEAVKERFLDLETRIRRDASDSSAQADLRRLLDKLQRDVDILFTTHPDTEASKVAAKGLGRELHPYFVRSALAERCIRRPHGVTGTAEILAHVLVDAAGGDGALGEYLDRWFLDRPSLAAFRAFREPTVDLVASLLPTHRNRRVLLVNAGTGSLVAGLTQVLSQPPTVLTVVDQSREALAFLDAGVTSRPRGIELQTVQENLAQFAMGRSKHAFPQQDVVVLHGLLEYLPERIAVSLLEGARHLLTDEGSVVASALMPSDDQVLLDRLLLWPTIRRSGEALRNIFRAAGMEVRSQPELPAPALLMAGRPLPAQ